MRESIDLLRKIAAAQIEIKTLHNKLDEALVPGGVQSDVVTLTFSKRELAMLIASIETVLELP